MSGDLGKLLYQQGDIKIYERGVSGLSVSLNGEIVVAGYSYGKGMDLTSGEWTEDAFNFVRPVGNGSLSFGADSDGNGRFGLNASLPGPWRSNIDLGFVISETGTFTLVVGPSWSAKFGNVDLASLGANVQFVGNLGTNQDEYIDGHKVSPRTDVNAVMVMADGSVIESILVTGNTVEHGQGFLIREYSPEGKLLDTYLKPIAHPIEAGQAAGGFGSLCFAKGTAIDMWPSDPALASADCSDVLDRVWQKPIEEIVEGDCVVSFDSEGNLTPSRVVRLFRNDAKILLDFFGTGVTPGHVYLRSEQGRPDRFDTLIDILRDDAAIVTVDGQPIRASTGVPIGDFKDGFVQVVTGPVLDDGAISVREKGKLRLGTRFITHSGRDHCLADLIAAAGGTVNCDGLVQIGSDAPRPFHWDFDEELPRPEDYILNRSGTNLTEIYRAAEWQEQHPRLPAPLMRDGGPVAPASAFDKGQIEPNRPLAGSDEHFAFANPPTLHRGHLGQDRSGTHSNRDQEFHT